MPKTTRSSLVLLFTAVIIISGQSLAQENAGNEGAKTDEGKRSTIVEADGYAYLSEDKMIKDIRQEALTNAKRNALESAQTYIQSLSKVENFQLAYDLIITGTEGFVNILESKDHGITTDNRYRYWIKAEVEYALKAPENKSDLAADLAKDENAPLTVYVWTEKPDYTSGEKIRIFLQGNKDFYARVVYRDAQGNLLQLLPNPYRQDNFFRGGKVITIPDEQDHFDLAVGPPFGIENIIVYASSAQMGEANVTKVSDALYGVQGDLTDYGKKSRGVKIIRREEDATTQGAEFYEARCEVRTKM